MLITLFWLIIRVILFCLIYTQVVRFLRSSGLLSTVLLQNQRAQFYVMILAEAACIALCSVVCLVLAPVHVIRLGGRRPNDLLHDTMTWCYGYLVVPVLGLEVEFILPGEGNTTTTVSVKEAHDYLSKQQPCVYLMNHQSSLDALIVASTAPLNSAVLMKKSVLFMPFLGVAAYSAGSIFIDRFKRDRAIKSMQIAGERIKQEKLGVFVFPEGTRSRSLTPDLLAFKKGAFHLAVQAGVPLVSVVVPWYKTDFYNFEKGICNFSSRKLTIQVLKTIPTSDRSTENVDELIEESRSAMLDCLNRISAPGGANGVQSLNDKKSN